MSTLLTALSSVQSLTALHQLLGPTYTQQTQVVRNAGCVTSLYRHYRGNKSACVIMLISSGSLFPCQFDWFNKRTPATTTNHCRRQPTRPHQVESVWLLSFCHANSFFFFFFWIVTGSREQESHWRLGSVGANYTVVHHAGRVGKQIEAVQADMQNSHFQVDN